MKHLITLIWIILLQFYWAIASHAQYMPLYGQYMLNPILINPAYAGSAKALSTSFHVRNQWVNFDPDKDISPSTVSFNADTPLKNKKSSVGTIMVYDKFAITSVYSQVGIFSHQVSLSNDLIVNMGLQLGFNFMRQNFSKLEEINDPVISGKPIFSRFIPLVGMGAMARYKKISLSMSMPQVKLSSPQSTDSEAYKTVNLTQFFTHLEYELNLNKEFTLKPSVLSRFNNISGFKNLYINTIMDWQDMFGLGVSYNINNSLMALFKVSKEQLTIAYAYEISTHQLGHFHSGSHEVMIKYVFRYGYNAINTKTFR
jgi:type IX secretion system PorP/SprF family membrane protein